MLKTLLITNYALIDSLELQLSDGLSIITGETGAGKSVMLGALSLLLGGRADLKSIRDSSRKSVIEAVFAGVAEPALNEWLRENALDEFHEVVVRRELTPGGRSRAFINDTPVNLMQLSQLTARLVDIHSQHQTLMLQDADYQMATVDLFAGNGAVRESYAKAYRDYVGARRTLRDMKEGLTRGREELDILQARIEDLEAIKPRRGELKELEATFDRLQDAGELGERLAGASALLSADDEANVLTLASRAADMLEAVDFSLFPEAADSDLKSRLKSLRIELADIAATVEELSSSVEDNPALLERVEERMAQLHSAVKRYKVTSDDELLELLEDMRRRRDSIDVSPEDIARQEALCKSLGKVLKQQADALTESRMQAGSDLCRRVEEEARPLGMPHLAMCCRVSASEKMTSKGQDQLDLLCAFNKNQEPRPLGKVASGGETSRLMLALKSVMSEKSGVETVVFDEVDTGVSGEIADRMGLMMQRMAKGRQVVAITHLPQVASRGQRHFKVYKSDREDSTVTQLAELSGDARIEEIARMLSGASLQEAALRNAESLLHNALHTE